MEAAMASLSKKRSRGPKSPKILVVEDNPIISRIHVEFLKQLGCTVECVESGKDALLHFKNYDLIFLDIGLPDMKGTEVCQQMRFLEHQQPRDRRVGIFAATAYGDEMKTQCLRAGFDGFLVKPVSETTFSKILKRWVFDKH